MKSGTAAGLGLGQLAGAGQQLQGADASTLSSIAQQQNAYEQAQLNDAYARWQQQMQYPTDMLNARLSAVASTPVPKSTTQTTSGGSSSSVLSGLGGAIAGANLGGQLGTASGLFSSGSGAIGGSLLGGLLGIFSDEREKEDIQKVGKGPNGLSMYAYRYKGDPKTYPKVVGPMAQEVERKAPGSTTKVGGRLVINGLAGSRAA
jgi:hypothetical protein